MDFWIVGSWKFDTIFFFLDFDQVVLIQYFLSWILIKSGWSNFFLFGFCSSPVDPLFFFLSTRLDQHSNRKNWINLTWAKSRKKHIGSSRFSGLDLFDPNPGSRYIFCRPLSDVTASYLIWPGPRFTTLLIPFCLLIKGFPGVVRLFFLKFFGEVMNSTALNPEQR